jgi:hypothetical protein
MTENEKRILEFLFKYGIEKDDRYALVDVKTIRQNLPDLSEENIFLAIAELYTKGLFNQTRPGLWSEYPISVMLSPAAWSSYGKDFLLSKHDATLKGTNEI